MAGAVAAAKARSVRLCEDAAAGASAVAVSAAAAFRWRLMYVLGCIGAHDGGGVGAGPWPAPTPSSPVLNDSRRSVCRLVIWLISGRRAANYDRRPLRRVARTFVRNLLSAAAKRAGGGARRTVYIQIACLWLVGRPAA